MNQHPLGSHAPQPRDDSELNLDIKRAVLSEALDAFSRMVIANDQLFSAVQQTLGMSPLVPKDAVNSFRIVPHIKDGAYSLCVKESAKWGLGAVVETEDATGYGTFTAGTMKYIKVCEVERDEATGRPNAIVDRPFVNAALGRDVASAEKPSPEEIDAMNQAVFAVLGGVNEIVDYCSQRGAEVCLDRHGLLMLVDEAERTFILE